MATIVGKFFKAIGQAVKNAPKAAIDMFKAQGKAAGQLLSGNPSGAWQQIKGAVTGIAETAKSTAKKAAENLEAEKFTQQSYLSNEPKQSFATGGSTPAEPLLNLLSWRNVAIIGGVFVAAWLLFTKVLKRR